MCFSFGSEAWKGSAGHISLLSWDQSRGLRKKQSLPVALGHYHWYFFHPGRSCEQCCGLSGTGGSWCLQLRLLPQPRPSGQNFLGPFKRLGASPLIRCEAGPRAGRLPSRWEAPALGAICPIAGWSRQQHSPARGTGRR